MQVCTLLQTDNHTSTPPLSFFTGRMPFLPPNQQRQSTEGIALKPSVWQVKKSKLYQSISQSVMHFRVVQVIKSLQDPLDVGNNLPGINHNVGERRLEQKCF